MIVEHVYIKRIVKVIDIKINLILCVNKGKEDYTFQLFISRFSFHCHFEKDITILTEKKIKQKTNKNSLDITPILFARKHKSAFCCIYAYTLFYKKNYKLKCFLSKHNLIFCLRFELQ